MAKCPNCNRSFDDALRFCLDDGTPLTSEAPTSNDLLTVEFSEPAFRDLPKRAVYESVPTVNTRRTGGQSAWTILAVVVMAIGGVVLIGGGAVAGFLYYISTSERGSVDTQTEQPKAKRSPSPLDTLGNVEPSNRSAPPTIDLKKPQDNVNKKPVPKQISGGVINGKAISLPKPPYPAAARAVRASGSVTVQVLVDESGNVVSASAISGHPLLRPAAASAARGAKFNPTLLSGQPVKVSGVLTYNFQP